LNKKEKLRAIDILNTTYPNADCELRYKTPFQLLIATILSAQTTDIKVNQVTETLFVEYPDLEAFLTLTVEELQGKIKTIGLHKSKANNIIRTCRLLAEKYKGKVPKNLEDLTSLYGVGRKTANVVLANAFNEPAIAVDTHVFRVSNRIGIVKSKNPLETEKQLMKAIPKEMWSKAHHLLIWHGRRICKARKPECYRCPLLEICKYKDKNIVSS
jgi:endonuclease-3